jgi:hypothetical protein
VREAVRDLTPIKACHGVNVRSLAANSKVKMQR